MFRVVLDTNIYISGLIWGGVPGEILAAWTAGEIEVAISAEILKEIIGILERLAAPEPKISRLQSQLIGRALMVQPQITINLIAVDPTDNKFLECAVEAGAHFIISGDKHLLNLKNLPGIEIITASKFLQRL